MKDIILTDEQMREWFRAGERAKLGHRWDVGANRSDWIVFLIIWEQINAQWMRRAPLTLAEWTFLQAAIASEGDAEALLSLVKDLF